MSALHVLFTNSDARVHQKRIFIIRRASEPLPESLIKVDRIELVLPRRLSAPMPESGNGSRKQGLNSLIQSNK
jgi:hypothetical protein